MKINEDRKFNPIYPEEYDWNYLDSRTGSELGEKIADAINHQLKKEDAANRNDVPGLRMALNILADYYEA